MNVLYNLAIFLYTLSVRMAAIWNNKARKWVDGRKTVFDELKSKVNSNEKKVWFHCASLGEFEQARPVIELFKHRNPTFKILLTFFSPSGYEVRKNYTGADYIFYLPVDTAANARQFVELVNPSLAVFAKYDFWFNYLQMLHKSKIPVVVFSAVFRKEQYFFQEYGEWFLKILSKIDVICVQDEESRKLLRKAKFNNVMLCGDTRFDRVMQIAGQPADFPLIERFKNDKITIVAGSTWPDDERIIIELIKKRKDTMKFIIAPHETDEKRIAELMEQIPVEALRFSQANEHNISDAVVLVIDSIGILSQVYRYADVAYVGGGFGKGIHNILEPAAFSVPVIIGPNYKKFNEAVEMVNLSMAFTIDKFRQMNNKITDLFFIKGSDAAVKRRIAEYMKSKKGATQQVVEGLEKLINATK
ncbi:MAG: 3-deoxy-D-manno-octulosonic acid transferase [Bacteroidia bacterium]|nr:3-deoxy-D-manno-octulosonic acid transferase [Bacteroidia bacterium]